MSDRFEDLLAALDHPKSRSEAIKGLGALGDARAVEPLGRVLRDHDDSHAMAYLDRKLAAEALGQIGDPAAIPHLNLALEDESSAVKASAATALGQIGDPGAINALVPLLDDRNAAVREAAARALGRLYKHDPELPVTPLLPLLADPEDALRDVAAEVLRGLGAQALDPLIGALKDTNSTIRGAAANLLGELGDGRARKALREVQFKDKSAWVRSRAEWAMKQLPPSDDPWEPVGYKSVDLPERRPTLDIIRERGPQAWPSLREDDEPVETPPPRPEDSSTALEPLSQDKIQEMLDLLDVRLASGEISEETYKKLVARWKSRLDE